MNDGFSEDLLTSCDREPIHIPGAIQPHGLLLIVDPSTGSLLGRAGEPATVGLQTLQPDTVAHLLDGRHEALLAALPQTGPVLLATVRIAEREVNIVAHRSGSYAVLELELASTPLSAAGALGAAQSLSSRLESALSIDEVCQTAADAVFAITGYERIMVYRFLPDGSGAVLAEARDETYPPLLNHHFPASDIPRQARALYARNHVRVIPDSAYTPAPLEWLGDAVPEAPLDMSDSHLRSVSPIHLQYLRNMEVGASASISIMVGGELWGLIACHNATPRNLDFVARELCKHVGQIVGIHIASRVRAGAQHETVTLAQRRDELLQILIGVGSIAESLIRHRSHVLRAIPADGIVICNGEQIVTAGSTPDEDALRPLLAFLTDAAGDDAFATSQLAARFEPAKAYAAAAAGVLSVTLRKEPRLVVAWLRAERLQTVNWAGNPHKLVNAETGVLTPRQSFDLWRETVEGQSRPWSSAEIKAAEGFRAAILDILDQQEMRSLNHKLRSALNDREDLLEQKDILMREVHHRVQNSLQLVNSMLYLQERESQSEEVRTQFDLARQRLTAVAMVHKRLWRTDKLGDVRLDSFITELMEELATIWGEEWRSAIHLDLVPVTISTNRSVILGLIVTELLTNAVKYAYGGAPGPLLVETAERGDDLRIAIADRGSGLNPNAAKSFGSRLIQAMVQQLSGKLDLEDNAPGLRAVLTIPAKEPI